MIKILHSKCFAIIPKNAVVEPEGRIAAQKCTDIVVRHVAVSPSAAQQTDKFRIHIFDESSPGELVGKRDILATLHPGVPDPSDNRHSSSLPHHRAHAAVLPPEGESETLKDYPYLHLTVNQKLVFAYVLGLV